MITITVCVGSSCHIKGARKVIGRFEELMTRYGLHDKVELKGCFCMERCGEGVNWQIGQEQFTSANDDVAVQIFEDKVLGTLGIVPRGPVGPGTAAVRDALR